MIKAILKLTAVGMLAAAIAGLPLQARAQSTNKAEKKESAEKKTQTAGPFHGKLASVDKSAKTITVGKRTFHITSETKILKSGKPAVLEDVVVGEEISGGFKTSADGKLVATKVNIGPKGEEKAEKKKAN